MKKLFYACFTALTMLFAMTGFTRAQIVLSFPDLYSGDKYGKYVPFHAKLTSGGVEQQNFEVYYTYGGREPSKNDFLPGEEGSTGIYRVVATGGRAEFIMEMESMPYFKAVAYTSDGSVSNTVAKALTALFVDEPSFDPPAPKLGVVQVAPNTAVKIVDNAGGAEIYYSTDGQTTPLKSQFGKNANIYKYDDAVGVPVPKDVVIRAIAYKSIDGNEGGSDMVRGKFEMDNKPQVHVSLNLRNKRWVTDQAAPILTVNTFNGATLGTGANDIALKLDFSIDGQDWTQIVTESGTPLNMAKAIAAGQDDYCSISFTVVKGNATSVPVNNIPVTPELIGFDVEVPGEAPAIPVFSPPGRGKDGKSGDTVLVGTEVTIECATDGAEIYYNINKDDAPTARYTKALVISKNSVVKALSRKGGKASDIAEAVYVVTNDPDKVTHRPETVEKPTFTVPAGAVVAGTTVGVRCRTPQAQIYYTVDGRTPTAQSTLFTEDITVNAPLTIKAIAVKGGLTSEVAEASYTIKSGDEPDEPETVAKPTFSPEAGAVEAGTVVHLNCATPDVQIRYTVSGSTPTASSTLYSSANGIKINGPTTIKAIAIKDGLWSEMAEAAYTIKDNGPDEPETVAKPTFSPEAGAVEAGTVVHLDCTTPGAEIRYTVDGGTPTASSTLYAPATGITVNEPLTIKAIAVKGGLASEVAEAAYTLKGNEPEVPETIAMPTFEPAAGEVNAGTAVYLDCETPGAEIHYTVDGTTPTSASTVYTKAIVIKTALTLKAIAVKGELSSEVAEAIYTIKADDPSGEKIELYFNPASGSEVNEGRSVSIIASKPYISDIFYMMFGSEEEARSTEWDQGTAMLYSTEMQPVLSKGENTIKAAYVRPGATAIDQEFFYATYTVFGLSDITLTFDPASGSEVEDGTTVTVTANHEVNDIFYNVYADEAEADADGTFALESKEVFADGMPVITKDKPFLRCGVFNAGWQYFDAAYTVKDKTPDTPPVGSEIELTFDPASDSEVEDGTAITVTANRDVDIYYSLYADQAAADADGSFIFTAGMVAEGAPVITKDKPFLRCGVFDGKMVYFDAAYKVKVTVTETVAKPTFSVAPGEVEKGTEVEIACETEGAGIYFTVDGTDPTAKSMQYREAIEIDESMTVKAIAIKGGTKSEVAKATYKVKVANEDVELTGVKVYPNPGDGLFHIELPEAATVDVYASNGALFRRLHMGAGVSTFSIERSGIYFLRIAGDGGRVTIKRIIVR